MRRWWLAGIALAVVATAASAQKQFVVAGGGSGDSVLSQLLTRLDWNPESRGALLVVAPEKARGNVFPVARPAGLPRDVIFSRRRIQAEDVPPPNGPGYSLLTLEKYVDRKAVTVGSVTVFAPRTMDVLNWQRLPEPSATAGLTRGTKVRLWEASLTDAQWKKYASPEGIGAADCNREQAKLFLDTLPTNVRLINFNRAESGGFSGTRPVVDLTDAQRNNLRRTLYRRLSWNFLMSNGGQLSFGDMDSGWSLNRTVVFDGTEEPSGEFFGQTLRARVPSRAKPGHIDFDSPALAAGVDLAGVKTVGELVKRCSAAVRVPVHCDPRYAGLTVFVRGDSARAGDLLKAIALGVTGTYRKVGTDYVLTDDIVPLGTRLTVILEWIGANSSRTMETIIAASKAIAGRTDEVTQWAGNGERPDDALMERIAAQKKREREPWTEADAADPTRRQFLVPVAKMPESARQRIAGQLQQSVSFGENVTIRKDVVIPQVRMERGYFLTGFGAIRDQTGGDGLPENFDDFQPPVLPKVAPAPLPRRGPTAAMVDAVDPADAEKKVALAAKAGFDAVWVAVPAGAKGILERAVEIGKREKIAVHAAVRLVRTRDDYSEDRDPTVLGETPRRWAARQLKLMGPPNLFDYRTTERTILANQLLEKGDYLRIDRPTDRARLLSQLSAAAKVPGVAGVVALDWCPAGYLGPSWLNSGFGHAAETGYSPELRHACLRANGFDPADCGPRADGFYPFAFDASEAVHPPNLELPFFSSGTELDPAWRKVRAPVASAVLEALRTVELPVPRLILVNSILGTWAGSFDKAAPANEAPVDGVNYETITRRAREAAPRTSTIRFDVFPFYNNPIFGETIESGFARWTREIAPAKSQIEAQGRVYDLTMLKPAEQDLVLSIVKVEPRK